MTMSVSMLAEIAAHAKAMADEAQAMAAAVQAVVDDCAEQLAAKRGQGTSVVKDVEPSKEPDWVADAEASLKNEQAKVNKARPEKKYSLTEVRAYVAERTKPENRAQIKAILKRFGVSKLTELPEDKYPALMEEVSRL